MATFNSLYNGIEAAFKSNFDLKDIEKSLIDEVLTALRASVSTQGGVITSIDTSAGRLVSDAIKKFVESEAYKKSLARFLQDVQIQSNARINLYKDANMPISTSDVSLQQNVILNQFIDALNESGLNSRFNQTLRTAIYDNIRLQQSQAQIERTLRDRIRSNGNQPSDLNRYVRQISIQAADAYNRAIDTEIFRTYKDRITHFRVVGSLIDTSSPQCRQAVEKYNREIPIEELDKWITFAQEHGGDPTLSKDNLSTLGGHYNCRHQFLPIIKK
jgi:hypothetical protein